jgi:hypothetical protein
LFVCLKRVKTEIFDRAYLAKNRDQETSIRWLARSRGGMTSATLVVCRRLGIMKRLVGGPQLLASWDTL